MVECSGWCYARVLLAASLIGFSVGACASGSTHAPGPDPDAHSAANGHSATNGTSGDKHSSQASANQPIKNMQVIEVAPTQWDSVYATVEPDGDVKISHTSPASMPKHDD